jgi:diguanylate cyclase (GGDEF)-like protein
LTLSAFWTARRADEVRSAFAMFVIAVIASFAGTQLTHWLGGTSAIWPANGLVLGGLLSIRRQRIGLSLAAVLAGNLLADRLIGDDWPIGCVLASCNTAEIAVAVLLLCRRLGEPPDLTKPGRLITFCALGVVPGPFVSSLAAAGLLALLGRGAPGVIFKHWFCADALALALFTPLVLVLRSEAAKAIFRREKLGETGGVLLLVALVSVAIFDQSRYPMLYLIHAPLLLAVFRLGFTGLMLGLILTFAIALGFTSMGRGPFLLIQGAGITEQIFDLQVFLATSLLLFFPVATALAQRDRATRALESRASRDGLTTLYNRQHFDQVLEREWRRATRLAPPTLSLLLVDVDHFKRYNDRYGHPAGDDCLRAIAKALAEMARREDDVVARYGGEEFVLVLPNTPMENAAFLAERICRHIETLAVAHDGSPCGVVTVSIGCATGGGQRAEGAAAGPAQLIDSADRALYEAKHLGRNRVVIAPT